MLLSYLKVEKDGVEMLVTETFSTYLDRKLYHGWVRKKGKLKQTCFSEPVKIIRSKLKDLPS